MAFLYALLDVRSAITVTLTVTPSGEMLSPFVIFKDKWKLKLTHPSGVVVAVQDKDWMDEPLMLQYIKEIWSKSTKTQVLTVGSRQL